MYAFQSGGDLVVSDEESLDEAQASGRWIRVSRGQEEGHGQH